MQNIDINVIMQLSLLWLSYNYSDDGIILSTLCLLSAHKCCNMGQGVSYKGIEFLHLEKPTSISAANP